MKNLGNLFPDYVPNFIVTTFVPMHFRNTDSRISDAIDVYMLDAESMHTALLNLASVDSSRRGSGGRLR